MPKPRITQDEWIEAVRNSAGVVALVAAKLCLSRQTIWEHRKKHAWLDEAFKETTEQSLDLAEANISAALQAGNLKATMWYLERKGKTRGFGRELQIESDSLSKPQVILYLPDNGRKRKPQ